MAKLSFRVESDVSKVIELRTEIKKLEEQLKRMDGGADFNRINTILQKTRKEYADITSELDLISKVTKQAFTIDTSDVDKLSRAIQDADDKQRSLGRAIRDSRLEQKEVGRGDEYDKLATQILNLQREQNRYKDLLVSLKSEQKEQNRLNKEQIISEGELEKIRAKGVKSIQEANDQNRKLRYSVKQIKDGDVEAIAQRRKYNEIIERNTEYIRRNSDAMTKQKMGIGGYKDAIRDAINSLKMGGNTMQNFGTIAKNTGGILKTKFSGGLNQVTNGVGNMIKGFVGAQAVLTGIRKFFGLLQDGVRAITDFEEANSNLQAVLRTTKEGIKDLEFDARRLGATTRYTASEVTALQIELAKLGFSREEILDSTEAVLKFAQATKSGLAESAKLAGASLRAFGADTKEVDRYVSAMAVGTTKSALSFSFLETAMSTVAPVANAFKFSIEDTVALLGSLADAGFDASSSATATRNILLNLADSNGKLAKSLGGSANTLPELVAGLNKLRASGVDLNKTLELTDKRSVAAFNTFLDGADKILELRKGVTDVQGELDVMAETVEDNVAGAVRSLQSAWEGFMLSFSSSTGTAKKVITFFTRGIRKITQDLMSDDDLFKSRIASEQAGIRSTLQEFKVVENLSKDIKAEYDKLVNAGMSADEASLKAKESYLKKLENNSNKELALEKKLLLEKEQLEKEYSKMGVLSVGRKPNVKKRSDIDSQLVALSGERFRTDFLAEAIEALNFVQEKAENSSRELSDKEKKAQEKQAKALLEARKKRDAKLLEMTLKNEEDKIKLMKEGAEKRMALIKFEHDREILSIDKNAKEAGLEPDSPEVLQAYTNASNKRKQEEDKLYSELEQKYRTYEQRKSDINKQFDEERKILEENGATEQIEVLEKKRIESLKSVNAEQNEGVKEASDLFIKLFEDAGNKSIKSIKAIIDETRALVDYLKNTNVEDMVDSFGFSASQLQAFKGDVKTMESLLGGLSGKVKELGGKSETEDFMQGIKDAVDLFKEGNIGGGISKMSQSIAKTIPNLNKFAQGMESAFGVDVSNIVGLVEDLTNLGDGLGKLASGDWLGGATATFSAITSVIGKFRSSRKAHEEELRKIEADRLAMQRQYNMSLIKQEELLKKTYSAFGEEKVRRATLNLKSYAEANKSLTEEMNGVYVQAKKQEDFKKYVRSGSGYNSSGQLVADVDGYKRYLKERERYEKDFQNGMAKLAQVEVVTGSKKRFLRSSKKIYTEIGKLYDDLLTKEGDLNRNRVESIMNTRRMSDADKAYLQNLLDLDDQMKKSREEFRSYVKETFGIISDSAITSIIDVVKGESDNMWDNFKDGGVKAMETLGEQILYQAYFSKAFEEFEKQIEDIYDREDDPKKIGAEIGNLIDSFYKNIETQMDGAKDFADMWKEQAKEQGLEIWKSGKLEASRGKGFETMSQDTATELNGRFIANNELLTMIRDSLIKIEGVEAEDYGLNSLIVYEDIREINSRMLVELVGINNNTGSVVEPIKSMSSNLAKLNNNIASLFD